VPARFCLLLTVLVIIGPACTPSMDAPFTIPKGAQSLLYVTFRADGHADDILAIPAGEATGTSLASLTGTTLDILAYDASFAELGMQIEAQRLEWTDVEDVQSIPLPLPDKWLALVDGAFQEQASEAVAFHERFKTARVALTPCPTLTSQSRDTMVRIDPGEGITFLARSGEDHVVFGSTAPSTATGTSGPAYVSRADRAGESQILAFQGTRAPAPRGFGLSNGDVYFTSNPSNVPLPDLCRLSYNAASADCAPMVFTGPTPGISPERMIGQLVDGKLEALMMNWENTLFYLRDDEWRALTNMGLDPAARTDRCGGFPTIAFEYIAAREAIVTFPAGPMVHLTIHADRTFDTQPILVDTVYERFICKGQYQRFPQGGELAVVVGPKRDGQLAGPLPEALWRATPDVPFRTLDVGEPVLTTQSLVPFAGGLLSGATVNGNEKSDVRFVLVDGAKPRACPLIDVGTDAEHLVVVGDRIYFGGQDPVKHAAITWAVTR